MYLSNTVIRFLDLDRRSKKGHLGPFGPFLGQIWGSVLDPMYVLSRGWGSKKRSKKRSKKGPKGVIWGLRGLRGVGGSGGRGFIFDQKGTKGLIHFLIKKGSDFGKIGPLISKVLALRNLTLLGPPNLTQKGPKRVQKGVKRVIWGLLGSKKGPSGFDHFLIKNGSVFGKIETLLSKVLLLNLFSDFGPDSDPRIWSKKGQKGVILGHFGSKTDLRI